jgi:hypothetical protein
MKRWQEIGMAVLEDIRNLLLSTIGQKYQHTQKIIYKMKTVKVRTVHKDKTESVYDVQYPKPYVQKIIDEENKKGDGKKVNEIYVNDIMVVRMISNELVHYTDSIYEAKTQIKEDDVVTVEIPGNTYWVSTSTAGNTLISYINKDTPDDDLPF